MTPPKSPLPLLPPVLHFLLLLLQPLQTQADCSPCEITPNGFTLRPGTGCREYVACHDGVEVNSEACYGGLVFDLNVVGCNWDYVVTCPSDEELLAACPDSAGETTEESGGGGGDDDGGGDTEGGTSAETETTTSNSTDVEGDDDDQVDDAVDDDLAGVNATSFNDDAFLGNETAADDFSDVVNSTDVNVDIVNATDDAIDLGMDDDDNNATVSTTELVTSSPVAAVVIASPTAAPATVEPESDATTAPTYVDSKAMEVTLAPNPAITRDDNGTEEETVDEDGMDDGIRNSTESIFAALSEEANSGMSVMTSSFRSRVTISMVGVGVVSTVAAFIAL